MIGTTLGGRYAIQRQLGHGGMGAVFEARHTGTGRRVAVKVITADIRRNPTLVARFAIEARAAGGLESKHIAQVLDVGHDEAHEAPYMVMEYLSGEDILHLVGRLGPLPPHLALRITAQACLGLEKAHKANIIHRDIKAANLFLVEQDAGEHVVKILDFGIAKVKAAEDEAAATGGITKTGSIVGSPLYMSPEQARGSQELDRRSDIWSLGVVLYQLLTGRTPFQGVEALGELIIRLCSEKAPSVRIDAPWVAPEVAQLVAKTLTIDASQRFGSAEEMFGALRALLPGDFSIHTSMLVPLSEVERAAVAPPVAPSFREGPVRAPAPSAPQLIAMAATPAGSSAEGAGSASGDSGASMPSASSLAPLGMSTGAGVTLAPRRRRKEAAVVLASVLGAAVLGGGAVTTLRGRQPTAATPGPEPAPSATTSTATSASAIATTTAIATATTTATATATASAVTSATERAKAERKPAPATSPTSKKRPPTQAEIDAALIGQH